MSAYVKDLKKYVHDTQTEMHTSIPGKIEDYDADKGTATIQPSGKFKKGDGSYLDYPKLYNVPVSQIQNASQNCTIALPIKKGDGCMVFFSEQQLDYWKDDQEPKTDLKFDLSNAVAQVGLCRDGNPVSKDACDNDAIVIQNKDDSKVTIKEDNIEIKLKNCTINISNSGEIEINAEEKAIIKAPALEIEAETSIKGNVAVVGNIDVLGDVSVPTCSLAKHVHAGPGIPGANP